MQKNVSPEDIDALLPQTQCGLCGHGGCMPYAEAIVFENAPINLCPPGGTKTLQKLGQLLNVDPTPYVDAMRATEKPAMRAVVREAECIGCTKCIKVCPVDAIIGSAKQMHSVISDECSGCELCIPACPVDCIDMVVIGSEHQDKADQYRTRYQAREIRLKRNAEQERLKKLGTATTIKLDYIAAARARAAAKKGK